MLSRGIPIRGFKCVVMGARRWVVVDHHPEPRLHVARETDARREAGKPSESFQSDAADEVGFDFV
jgi:hypothetical protein